MLLLYLGGAYLLGSISSAILVCRMLGQPDPRNSGSGNPGATNVLRQSGKWPALLTLAGDIAKGFVPVAVGVAFDLPPLFIAALGIGAFIGHLFPVFFHFKGGKGVATLIGVLFGFNVWLGLAFIGTWLVIAALTRYSSLSALISALVAPVVAWQLGCDALVVGAIALMVVILFWRHRTNIQKLLAGNESKIGKKQPTK